jgi:hypothetical protein
VRDLDYAIGRHRDNCKVDRSADTRDIVISRQTLDHAAGPVYGVDEPVELMEQQIAQSGSPAPA